MLGEVNTDMAAQTYRGHVEGTGYVRSPSQVTIFGGELTGVASYEQVAMAAARARLCVSGELVGPLSDLAYV